MIHHFGFSKLLIYVTVSQQISQNIVISGLATSRTAEAINIIRGFIMHYRKEMNKKKKTLFFIFFKSSEMIIVTFFQETFNFIIFEHKCSFCKALEFICWHMSFTGESRIFLSFILTPEYTAINSPKL